MTKRLKRLLSAMVTYPSAVFGLGIILFLIALSVYSVTSLPYSEAVAAWRGGEGMWQANPRNARPVWYNLVPGINRPVTIDLASDDYSATATRVELAPGLVETQITFEFDYTYDGFPRELALFLTGRFEEKRPHAEFLWRTPDGREISLGDRTIGSSESVRISQDTRLQRRLGGLSPEVGLFLDPDSDYTVPQKGRYELVVDGLVFEDDSTIEARFIAYGQLHGLAGTDHRRRDLMVALLWGTPVALAFGFLAAVGSTFTTMIIAGIGVWYGSWVDAAIQRITEVNLILPVLPILIMIGTMYSRSIWVILGVVILLGIFSAGIKTYRAMFFQVKEAPYIEAAQAYGAGSMRIVFRYMIPRILPVLIPQFVVLIPSFVFLEATLAVLGLGDPVLPTWGKVLNDAYHTGALHNGYYYWVLQPSALLMLTGLGFAMLGFALDRIFNPRLRGF